MNKQLARKHAVYSSTEANATLSLKALAFNTKEKQLEFVNPKSVRNVLLRRSNFVKNTSAIPLLVCKEQNFCVTQKKTAKMWKLAIKPKLNIA
jgi:hypothetical protein